LSAPGHNSLVIDVVAKPLEKVLFLGDIAAVGSFRCPREHPLFRDTGPCSYHTFVFPRTATIIRHDGGTPFTATPNCVTFYNQHQAYTRAPVSSVDASDWYVVADDVLFAAAGRDHRPFRETHVPIDAGTYIAQRRAFDRLDAMSALAVEEVVIDILDTALSAACHVLPHESERMRGAVEEAMRIIARAPGRATTLRALAKASGCSPFHLCRSFRRITGQTITEFRRDLRLRLALEKLRDGCPDLTTLALDLGFASHSHFTVAFRRHFGATPSEFRAIR